MPSLKKSKVKSSRWNLPAGLTVAFLALMLLLGPAGTAQASTVSIKLTSLALFNNDIDINHGKHSVVKADELGAFWTSTTTGEGSILQIQTDGLAGPGTDDYPLFVTVTARSRLDVLGNPFDFLTPNDYQAGIITLTKESGDSPDGIKEGLGVKAFTVNADGKRVLDLPGTGRALTEGSKHVSGGTDGSRDPEKSPNDPPHVDESVTFDFNPAFSVFADSVEVLLSDFTFTDIIVLSINGTFTDKRLSPADSPANDDASIFEQVEVGFELWKLKFAGLAGLSDILVDSFTIRSDVAGGADSGDKNHFFITGLTADAAVVPIPGAVWLLGSGLIGLAGIRRKFRK